MQNRKEEQIFILNKDSEAKREFN